MSDPAKFSCEQCGKGFNSVREGVVVNLAHAAFHTFELDNGQAYTMDFRRVRQPSNEDFDAISLCKGCLAALAERGVAQVKVKDTCGICLRGFNNLDHVDGHYMTAEKIISMGYGSKHDLSSYKFPDYLMPQWFCYDCLDALIEKGDAVLVHQYSHEDYRRSERKHTAFNALRDLRALIQAMPFQTNGEQEKQIIDRYREAVLKEIDAFWNRIKES